MYSQIKIQSKSLRAQFTLIWLFTCVCSIMPGQSEVISKGLRTQFTLKLIAFVLWTVARHFEHRARGHGRMLDLQLFITMGNQVAHDSAVISGDIQAGAACERDVLGDFQWAADFPQRCSSITTTGGLDRFHSNCSQRSGSQVRRDHEMTIQT
uniref:Putative homeobox transcription factor sip1 n=1 Tax=Ixodes ricinus TaxID=34613 RepID=A0A6B0UW98_IXORI